MSDSRWYFTEEQLESSPSRKCGISAELELSYRQRAANLIQEMGQRLQVSQLCINTAIVYMHRFYAFHSFTMFHRNTIAAAAFFLAAKVEEQPRKLEHVIKILNICLEKTDISREMYAEQAQELVLNENILLQTLGFDVAIDHPHTHVVKACQLFNIVTVSRELRQTCYFMASNSLHLTTMCLKYRPTVVAAFCIYIACKWSRWEIPDSSEGKAWYSYVDDSVTLDTLKKLTDEYLQILERSPSKFKSKMKAITTSNGQAGLHNAMGESSSSHHKNPNHHERQHQHHHHHHHRSSNSTSSNSGNSLAPSSSSVAVNASNGSNSRKQYPPGDQKAQISSSTGYKQNVPPQQSSSGSSSSTQQQQHQMQRQRPGPPTSSQQPPYPSSANKSMDERHRHQDQYYSQSQSSQQQQRMSDKHRMSLPSNSSSSSTSQQGYMKSGSDQKHSVIPNSSSNAKMPQPPPYTMDMGKNMKQNHTDYHNPRSNPMAQMIQQQASLQKKQSMPPWQQQTLPPLQIPPATTQSQPTTQHQQQIQYMQKNIQIPPTSQSQQQQQQQMSQSQSSDSNINNNNISKQQQHQQQQQQMMMNTNYSNEIKPTLSQNDFWFNDKINETPVKPPSPVRPTKSLFSPSPEHPDEKSKYMLMNVKPERDSPKEERKSTPSKREKMTSMSGISTTPVNQSQQKPQIPDRKIKTEINPPSTVDMAALVQDIMPNKKRPYSNIKDESANRAEKIRKVEGIKTESSSRMPQLYGSSIDTPTIPAKQPIETNPDIVKSLLKECFASSNKFDQYDNDSPLDVINPEPPEELLAVPSSKIDTMKKEPMDISLVSNVIAAKTENAESEDKMDSSAGEGHGGKHKKKSKKKKEKHKHKKKHKHSDRESSPSMRMILSKNNSPESNSAYGSGGLKIKIPIKDVASAINPQQTPQPAPIKLKISKEKFGSFTNLNNNNTSTPSAAATATTAPMSSSTSSSSSHKKKDKDRDKSKSKNSKSSSYHHHQQHSA